MTRITSHQRQCPCRCAQVPILRFNLSVDRRINAWVAVDLSLGNPLGMVNTELLARYADVDKRVAPLVHAIKRWSKNRGVADASRGRLSSYAYVVMVIFYLQVRDICVLCGSVRTNRVHSY